MPTRRTSAAPTEIPDTPATLMRGGPMPAAWRQPDAQGQGLTVDAFPGVLLVGTATLIQRHLTRPALEPLGIGVPEWRLLAFLAVKGSSSAAAMNAEMWMDKAQISRALATLVERGLVRREADPTHHKRQLLRLSTAGRRLHAKAMAAARAQQAQLLLALTPQERAGLFSALAKLRRLAESAAG